MKKLIWISYVLLLCTVLQAQQTEESKPPVNSIYLEMLGSGLTYTVNYDHIIYREPGLAFSGRVGMSYMPPSLVCCPTSLLVGLNALIGKSIHYTELGITQMISKSQYESRAETQLSLVFGYRYQPKREGVIFRATFTPMWTPFKGESFVNLPITPYAGASIGYTF